MTIGILVGLVLCGGALTVCALAAWDWRIRRRLELRTDADIDDALAQYRANPPRWLWALVLFTFIVSLVAAGRVLL